MRKGLPLTLSLACLLAPGLQGGSAQNPQVAVAHSGCEPAQQRQVLLSAIDKEGTFIPSLRAEDLSLTINDIPSEILSLDKKLDQPVAAVILIDNSRTQYFTFSRAKLAAQKFVEWNLRNKGDRAALVSFAVDATIEEDLTSDWTKLLSSISRLEIAPQGYPPGPVVVGRTPPIRPTRQGATAISDAVWASTDGILKSVTNSRRVIVVLTDGEDWTSITKLSEAIAYAGTNDVAVFAIDTNLEGHTILGRTPLTELAEDTGGRSLGLRKVQDLPEVLQKIDRQVRSHYALTYCNPDPAGRKSPAKLEIEIKNSQLRNTAKRLAYARLAL
jgi:VWFA-related protein